MFNMNDIMALMADGTTPEEIARNFTDELNKAIQFQEEQKRAARAKSEKLEAAQEIADRVNAFFETYYEGSAKADITGEEIIDICDSMKQFERSVKLALDDDAVIGKFLKSFGL